MPVAALPRGNITLRDASCKDRTEVSMAFYRLRHRYRVRPDQVFEAMNDEEALRKGRLLCRGSDYALRCADRCVALLRHDGPALLVAAHLDNLQPV